MVQALELLKDLSDGRFCSGEELAKKYSVSRMAVHNATRKLRDLGIRIDAVTGRGYRWRYPVELLDADLITSALTEPADSLAPAVEVLPKIDSTSAYLLRKLRRRQTGTRVCLAEYQSAGKGRRGRQWVSPFGSNLYMSLLWRFESNAAALGGLGLVVGVAVAEVLEAQGVSDIGLKWPNDLYWRGKKLGGILVEMSGRANGSCNVVIGIGLNVRMPAEDGESIDKPWTNLTAALPPDTTISRNKLAAELISGLVSTLHRFEHSELYGLQENWQRYDITRGKPVELVSEGNTISGVSAGIDALGRIVIGNDEGTMAYAAGDISLNIMP